MKNSKTVLIDKNPGRNCQTFGVARELGTSVDLIHEPSSALSERRAIHNAIGVGAKAATIHDALRARIGEEDGKMSMRLVQPEFTIATSDGIRNGTKEMRYSLIGREVTNDSLCEHFSASGLEGVDRGRRL